MTGYDGPSTRLDARVATAEHEPADDDAANGKQADDDAAAATSVAVPVGALEEQNSTRVVAIGGGHGLSRVLTACRRMGVAPTAVVTVADDGGSSGRLRRDLGIIALGDLRMALLALAGDEQLAHALAHRFARGHLQGHALGNLLLVALSEDADGDVVAALRRAEELLDCQGSVLPSTLQPVHIAARVAGSRVNGQSSITHSSGRLETVWLEPADPPACEQAVAAVREAEAIVLGPGSLFTSVIVNLLVPGLLQAVCDSKGVLVHVANVEAPPGETSHLSLRDHVALLHRALGGRHLDAIVMHDGPPPECPGEPLEALSGLGARMHTVTGDLLSRDAGGRVQVTHDPDRLAVALEQAFTLAAASPSGDGLALR